MVLLETILMIAGGFFGAAAFAAAIAVLVWKLTSEDEE